MDRLLTDYLQVWFEREIFEPPYNYMLFNHCGLYLPLNGIIWELAGNPIGIPQESADRYLNPRAYRMPISAVNLHNHDVSKLCRGTVSSRSGCHRWVAVILKKLGVIDVAFYPESVDDLFLKLAKYYRLPIEDAKKLLLGGDSVMDVDPQAVG